METALTKDQAILDFRKKYFFCLRMIQSIYDITKCQFNIKKQIHDVHICIDKSLYM